MIISPALYYYSVPCSSDDAPHLPYKHVLMSLGPLLPEDLDIRGIPIDQGTQLTIALSGKI